MNPNLLLAKNYMQCRVKILPCHESGPQIKAPRIKGGFKNATHNLSYFDLYSEKWPTAIWGLPTEINNCFVLDADRHGQTDGVEAMLAIFNHYKFDWRHNPVVQTPNDGLHVYFNLPPNLRKTRGQLCTGVDVKRDGYVIAPGMTLPDRRQYKYLNGDIGEFAMRVSHGALPEAPDWLIHLIEKPSDTIRHSDAFFTQEASLANCRALVKAVLTANEGNRNNVLFWASCRVGELLRKELISFESAIALLIDAGIRAGLTDRESQNTTLSGIHRGWGTGSDD